MFLGINEKYETLSIYIKLTNVPFNSAQLPTFFQTPAMGFLIFCYSLFHVSIQLLKSIVVGGDGVEAPFKRTHEGTL